ncbi:hypothetical protein GCAAIG_11970 [Candidatus Electronema halotolerans]|jgi:hypothetical protein
MTNFQGGMILLGVEEEMLVGQQCARNRMIMEVLRDYDMLIAWASVLPLMKKMNGRKPEFVAAQDYLKTVLHGRIAS